MIFLDSDNIIEVYNAAIILTRVSSLNGNMIVMLYYHHRLVGIHKAVCKLP